MRVRYGRPVFVFDRPEGTRSGRIHKDPGLLFRL